MIKKLIALFFIVSITTYNFNINLEAQFLAQTFQTNFEAVASPGQPHLFVGPEIYFQFDSECIEIPFDSKVFSVQTFSIANAINTILYRHPNDMFTSRINYFLNTDCDTNNNASHTLEDRFFQFNNSNGDIGDKPYVFNIANIGNHLNLENFTPKRSKSLIVSFASNIELSHLQSTAEEKFDEFTVSSTTSFSFQTPNIVRYVNGSVIIERFFINQLPIRPEATRPNFDFQYWRDINGNVQFGQIAVNDPSLIDANGVYTLFAFFTQSVNAGDPIIDKFLGGTNQTLDTILFNTGFLNNAGLLFIYFSLVIGISFLSFRLQFNNLITIILNVLLTAFFIILGYLPLFISIILVLFYIVAFISINKGGFLNE